MAEAEALSTQLASLKCLDELALELRVSWDHSTDDVWRKLDPELLELTRNPTLVLHATSETRLKALAADTEFRRRVEDFVLDDAVPWRAHALVPLEVNSIAWQSA
jgi:starch phosphorylase